MISNESNKDCLVGFNMHQKYLLNPYESIKIHVSHLRDKSQPIQRIAETIINSDSYYAVKNAKYNKNKKDKVLVVGTYLISVDCGYEFSYNAFKQLERVPYDIVRYMNSPQYHLSLSEERLNERTCASGLFIKYVLGNIDYKARLVSAQNAGGMSYRQEVVSTTISDIIRERWLNF